MKKTLRLAFLLLFIFLFWGCAPVPTATPAIEGIAGPTRLPTITPLEATPRPTRETTPSVSTETPTADATGLPTLTPTITPTPTVPPVVGDCYDWHPRGLHPGTTLIDHHGVNPCAFIPLYGGEGGILDNYLQTQGVCDGQPRSSASEEVNGCIWLAVGVGSDGVQTNGLASGAACALFVNFDKDQPDNCIVNLLIRVHTTGEVHHILKRFHSVIAFG